MESYRPMQDSRSGAATLVEILERRVAAHPDRLCYAFWDGERESRAWTWGELGVETARISGILRGAGAEVGDRALLLFPPGLEFVAAFLGCLHAGVVAVPAYPPRRGKVRRGHAADERLRVLTEDAAPRFALTEAAIAARREALVERIPALAAPRWLTVDEQSAAPSPDDALAPAPLDADSLAFLQYTSGSTSDPKGVMVTHGNLLANEESIRRAFGMTEESVVVGWLPLYHDMGLIGNVLQPLYAGASCVLMAPQTFLRRPATWLEAIHHYRATVSGGPNFAYDLCVERLDAESKERLDLSSWRVAYNGAEPVRAETLRRFADAFADCGFERRAFLPCYGLAEATLFVSGGPPGGETRLPVFDAAALEAGRAVPLGEDTSRTGARSLVSCGPMLGVDELLIVRPEDGRPAAAGEIGEIWLRGAGVTAGYWRRPDATRSDFDARPAGAEADSAAYLRTGDLGFVDGDELFVTGRLKDLIILRGRNHYPQDLERTAEEAHDDLRPGCGAAFSVPDEDGAERLVVVQEVAHRTAEESFDAVAAAVAHRVAALHEVEVHAVALLAPGTIPKTSSGKIRRRACRDGFLRGELDIRRTWRPGRPASVGGTVDGAVDGLVDGSAAQAPRTPTEERLTAIWSEVFGRRVGVEESFAELGGDSLRAAGILARLRDELGVVLDFDELLSASTVAETARLLDAGGELARDLGWQAPPTLEAWPRDQQIPLSHAQERLWFLHRLDPESAVYNVAVSLAWRGPLDVARLDAALAAIEERHEILRTVYALDGETPVQQVRRAVRRRLPQADLTRLPAARRRAEVERLGGVLARRPFDLERGPVLRRALLGEAAEVHHLVLVLHHIATDGGSLAVLLGELTTLYRDEAAPPASTHYADYAAWQRAWLRGEVLETMLAGWIERLGARTAAELPVLELPGDRPRPPVLSHRGARLESVVAHEIVARADRGDGPPSTPFTRLLATFALLLARYSGSRDLVVGTPVDGRRGRELEGMMGMFPNTLVLRFEVDEREDFARHLIRVRRRAGAAYDHRDLPFEALVDALRPERDLSRMPLVQVLFVGQSAPLRRRELGDAVLAPRELDTGTAQFDLSVAAASVEEGWRLTWTYASDLFDRSTVERMARHFGALLDAAGRTPERPVGRLDLLSSAERHQALTAWNDTARPRPGDAADAPSTLHGLFAWQAERSPERIAVVAEGPDGDRHWTFGALRRRAARTAARLRALGIGPGSRVAVTLERSAELVEALLGILEAGAAYVPVDPAYPAERRRLMIEDSGARVVISGDGLVGDGLVGGGLVGDGLVGDDTPPPATVGALDPAYVIYTSGSTGRPKGVLVPHGGAVGRLHWLQEMWPLGEGDRTLQKTSLSFDVSVLELFWPLAVGARLVLSPPGAQRQPGRLLDWIERHQVTTLFFVPSLLQLVLEEDDLARRLTATRRVLSTGEALPPALRDRFLELLPAIPLFNLYGPTEVSVEAAWHACRRGEGRRSVPIGRPIAETSTLILGRALEPTPIGVTGELLLGGPCPIQCPPRPGSASTAPATSPAGCPTARSNCSAASTIRSRCGVSASNWGRSRPP